jgi:nucleoside-diphosphate-sugar epimerase
MSIKNVVLIAGVHGVSGRTPAEHWASVPGTRVYGLSRRSAPLPAGVDAIYADLLDRENLQVKLEQISGITHIVFGAYIERPTATERREVNVAILKNLLHVVEKTSPFLRHVTFYQGGKAYGADLGPFKTPAREDGPPAHAAELLLRAGRPSPGATNGQGMALDGATPGSNYRLWSRQPHESWDVDCRLCRHLKGTRPPAETQRPRRRKS